MTHRGGVMPNKPNRWSRQVAGRAGVSEARRVLKEAVTEGDFQASVVEMAEAFGWRWWHDTDSRRNQAGLPDLILVRPPRLIFAELKTEKGLATTEQTEWLRALGNCDGVAAYLWRPSDIEEIEEALRP